MKKVLLSIVIIGISLCQISCGTTVPLLSNRKPYEVDTAFVLHLPSQIASITKGNKQEINELYSDSTFNIRNKVFNDHLLKYITPVPLEFEDSYEQNSMIRSFLEIISTVEDTKSIKDITLYDTMVRFLERKKIKYMILTFHAGFTREKGNYLGQLAIGIGIGLLTPGFFTPMPVKANSTMVCCILDTENRNIAFYRKRTAEVEPISEKVINRQLKLIMDSWLTASR